MNNQYLKLNTINKAIRSPYNKSPDELYLNKHFSGIHKQKKRGIIYLSTIPKYMNIIKIREIFSAYGQVGRIYLQLAHSVSEDEKQRKKKRKTAIKHFTEGWIEFEKKTIAKFVASALNNTQIAFKKKSKFYDVIWNIKYLPRFKWIHLSEKLAYERAIHKQRLKAEISQAKKEGNFFSFNVDRSEKMKVRSNLNLGQNFTVVSGVHRKDNDFEINKKKLVHENRSEFLKSLFA